MSKYTSTYILRANPSPDENELKNTILEGVNRLTTGQKSIYRKWIKLQIETPHPTTHYWILISSAKYIADRKPDYFYFSFKALFNCFLKTSLLIFLV